MNLRVLTLALIISIFSKELFTVNVSSYAIDLFAYPISLIALLTGLSYGFKQSKPIRIIILYVLMSGLIMLFILKLPFGPFLKTILGFILTFGGSSIIICNQEYYSSKDLFEIYSKITFYTAIFGVIQWVLSTTGTMILMKKPLRLDSIAYEPSHYSAILLPALIYNAKLYGYKAKKTIVLFTALILTFSLTSITAFIATMLIPKIRLRSSFILVIIVFASYKIIPKLSPEFKDRVESLEKVALSGDYKDSHITVLSMATNIDVMRYTLKQSPILGSGLGGHESMYYKFFRGTWYEHSMWYGMNQKSAHSLLIRITSEMGLLGLFIVLLFLYKHYIPFTNPSLVHHSISLAVLGNLISKCFKLGGYLDYGTPVFIAILLLNYNEIKR